MEVKIYKFKVILTNARRRGVKVEMKELPGGGGAWDKYVAPKRLLRGGGGDRALVNSMTRIDAKGE